jgi:ADP-ribose pyrophosphatase
LSFTKLGESLLHQGHIISLAVGTFRGPDGGEFTREIVHHPGAVSVVAVDDDGRVPLVRQYRAPLDDWLLELPAGKLDVDGEELVLCAQRELVEEAGLTAATWSLLTSFHHSPGFCDEQGHVFLAQGLTAVPDDRQGVEEQAMTVEWWPLSEATTMVTEGTVHDAKTVIGLLLAKERLGA